MNRNLYGPAMLISLCCWLVTSCGQIDEPPNPELVAIATAFGEIVPLDIDEIQQIELDDGSTPLVDGNWSRYAPENTWQWQLKGQVQTSADVDVYIVDLFDRLVDNTIRDLHNDGREVLCYLSVGTYEHWRPDAVLFSSQLIGSRHSEFGDERWLDISQAVVGKLMVNRLEAARKLGCDGVELDNIDGYMTDTGFSIDREQHVRFARMLANEAHKRGLSVAVKNGLDLLPQISDYFDLAINEQCLEWGECGHYADFIASGKPVFNAEYTQLHVTDPSAREQLCATARSLNLRTLVLPLQLDGSFRFSCDS